MKLKKISLLSFQITLAVMLLLHAFGVTGSLEERSLDLLLRNTKHPLPQDEKVILVTIDNSSLDYIYSNMECSWPWPRDYYAYILNYLKAEESGAVLFDLTFDAVSRGTSESESGEYDKVFAKAMQEHGNVYLAAQLSNEVKEQKGSLEQFAKLDEPDKNLKSFNSFRLPIDILMNASAGVSAVNIQTDKDGLLRYAPIYHNLITKSKEYYKVPSFTIGAIEKLKGKEGIGNIPTSKKGYRLNWYSDEFQICPVKAVLQSAIAAEMGKEKTLPDGYFKDAIVLIGATADGLNDLKHTPVGSQVPGIYVWATLLSNSLTNDYIHFTPQLFSLILFALFMAILLILTNTDKFVKPLIYSLILMLVIGLIAVILWSQFRLCLRFSSVMLIGLTYLLSFTFLSFSREYQEKRKIRQMFSRYISKEVVKELEKNPQLINLGGEEVSAAVLFSDVYNFTTLTETMKAKELVEHLNVYFTGLSDYITKNNGLLEAFLGDGILAVFGVPVQSKQTADYAMNACRTAIEQRDYVRTLNTESELTIAERMHTRTRIGIASGDVIAGNVGSLTRMDYTVIGDAVNIASRLETANKFYKTNVIICEWIYADVKESYLCRKLDKLRLKGKLQAITIYELVDKKTVDSQNAYSWFKEYEEALQHYFNGDFDKASIIFKSLSGQPLNDGASGVMYDRCMRLILKQPENWDGIFTMEVK